MAPHHAIGGGFCGGGASWLTGSDDSDCGRSTSNHTSTPPSVGSTPQRCASASTIRKSPASSALDRRCRAGGGIEVAAGVSDLDTQCLVCGPHDELDWARRDRRASHWRRAPSEAAAHRQVARRCRCRSPLSMASAVRAAAATSGRLGHCTLKTASSGTTSPRLASQPQPITTRVQRSYTDGPLRKRRCGATTDTARPLRSAAGRPREARPAGRPADRS